MGMRLKTIIQRGTGFQFLMPLMVLSLLLIVNLVADPIIMGNNPDARSFFSIRLIQDTFSNYVLSGNIISILNGASELAILAIGMTLVTAASGGQDIPGSDFPLLPGSDNR